MQYGMYLHVLLLNTFTEQKMTTKYIRFILDNLNKCLLYTLYDMCSRYGHGQSLNVFTFWIWIYVHVHDTMLNNIENNFGNLLDAIERPGIS